MKIKFEILVEVIFEHEYFRNGLISDMEIQPTQRTRELLRDFGLLFKKTERGFVVLYEIDTADAAEPPLKPLTSQGSFSFVIYMSHSCFTNYTNIPLNHKYPGIFYFDNLVENISATDLLLNRQNHADASDIVELASNIYNIEQPSLNPVSLIQISDISGTNIYSKTVPVEEGSLICQVDFDKIGQGRFDIRIDGSLYSKVYSDWELNRKSLFGILDIYKSGLVPPSYQFAADNGTVTKKTYKIRFARRNTTWKYFVILKNISTDPGLHISYGPKIPGEEIYPDSMVFSQATPASDLVDAYGAGKVILFESEDMLPLYETPKTSIKLLKPDTASEDTEPDVVIGNLPNAPISVIKTNANNTETFSEIFIYV